MKKSFKKENMNMAKETTENQQPALVILSQYIKDMSIESMP